MMRTIKASNTTDEQILAAAEAIFLKRLERQGRIAEPSEAGRYQRAHCRHAEREVFGGMFLDTRHHILACEDPFFDTSDGAEVHPWEVVKRGLLLNAATVVAFHNHASGNTESSTADRAVTARPKQVLGLVDIRLLDHIVVSAEGFTSIAARGCLRGPLAWPSPGSKLV